MKANQCSYHNCFLITLLLCTSLFSSAQSRNYQFRFLGLPESFKNQFITHLDEDPSGLLWFVTNNGLHRYDGNQVLTFDMQSKPSLPGIDINYLFADSHDNLWIATRQKLVRFDLKNWTTTIVPFPVSLFPTNRDRTITSIKEDKDGAIYLATANGKVFAYNKIDLHLIYQMPPVDSSDKIAHPAINTMQLTKEGNLFLASEKGQVVYLSSTKKQKPLYYELKEFSQSGIGFLAFDSQHTCFVYANEAGACLLDMASGVPTPISPPPGFATLKQGSNFPVEVQDGNVAIFFTASTVNPKGFAVYSFKDGLFKNLNAVYPPSFQNSVFRKVRYRANKIYISTDRGIATVTSLNNPFTVIKSDVENVNSIRTIYKDGNGEMYIGSYKDKFIRLNEHSNETRYLSEMMISCLLPWGKDSLLAGTEGNFPVWFFPSTNGLKPVFKTSPGNNNINSHIQCLYKENDTTVWAGTYAGYYVFNPHNGAIINGGGTTSETVLAQLSVLDILSRGGALWFATDQGIYKLNRKIGAAVRLFENADNNYATARYNCLQAMGNTIWAGSNGNGIVIFDSTGNIKKRLTTNEGLAGNIVYSLCIYKNFVLCGTSKGLSIIDESIGSIRSYSSQRYLPSNEFNRSAWLIVNDTVYMGTINGIIRFTMPFSEPSADWTSQKIKLLSFSVNNGGETKADYTVAYKRNLSLVVPAGTKSFSINFGGLNEIVAELDLFYRFEGNTSWQNIGQRREVTFINLSPGKYNILVGSRLPDGQWSKDFLNIPIDVRPLFYQTAWFRILLVLLGALLVWIFIKYRERVLRKEQQLRSRIAGDLHDEVGSALTRIYFQTQMLSTNAKQESPSASSIDKIAEGSQAALSSMSDMVWSIDAVYDNATDMVGRMKNYVFHLQEELESDVAFEVKGDYQKKHLSQISRQNIFLIFKEALTNAVKYGRHDSIKIALAFEKYSLMLVVQNDKADILHNSPSAQGNHGLRSMQLRAEKIKASLQIEQTEKEFVLMLIVKQ